VAACSSGARIDERSPLEAHPERRGSYSSSKQQAEQGVLEFMRTSGVPVTVLRPGTIYGPGGELYTPLMGFSAGSLYVVIGRRGFVLPFVHVENVASAIALSIEKPEAAGEVFNVIDPEPLTKRDYMNRVIRKASPRSRVLYLPFAALYAITWLQELAFGLIKRRPVLTRYRLKSSQAAVVYDGSKLARTLGWQPMVSRDEALEGLVAAERARRSPSAVAEDPAPRLAEFVG
jgi:nucleoside-diphosphate-sugar epimerase